MPKTLEDGLAVRCQPRRSLSSREHLSRGRAGAATYRLGGARIFHHDIPMKGFQDSRQRGAARRLFDAAGIRFEKAQEIQHLLAAQAIEEPFRHG